METRRTDPDVSWGGSGPSREGDHPHAPTEAPAFRVIAAIAEAVSADEVYQALVDRVADVVGASSAALWLVDGDGYANLIRSRGYTAEAARAIQRLAIDA